MCASRRLSRCWWCRGRPNWCPRGRALRHWWGRWRRGRGRGLKGDVAVGEGDGLVIDGVYGQADEGLLGWFARIVDGCGGGLDHAGDDDVDAGGGSVVDEDVGQREATGILRVMVAPLEVMVELVKLSGRTMPPRLMALSSRGDRGRYQGVVIVDCERPLTSKEVRTLVWSNLVLMTGPGDGGSSRLRRTPPGGTVMIDSATGGSAKEGIRW